jgi:hypothetical protein
VLRAKIGLALVVTTAVAACSLVDGLRGGTSGGGSGGDDVGPAECTGDEQICDFCEQRVTSTACGDNELASCVEAWTCVKGPVPACGLEFGDMLQHFLSNPSNCFDESIPAVTVFKGCKSDAGGLSCFE